MKDRLDRLTALISAPERPVETGTLKSWEKVEAQLGLRLPADYKALIDRYGTGIFCDWITPYNPFTEIEYLNLFLALETFHQAEQHTQRRADSTWTALHPFELYPAVGGLLPWGCTPNLGETFFWQVKGLPHHWETVFYNLRNGEYEVWKMPMAEFLTRLFSRRIESVLLPDGFPPGELTFHPVL